ncbi:tetratricopeptide repeat protein [Candidatus Dependentiae bacterium]
MRLRLLPLICITAFLPLATKTTPEHHLEKARTHKQTGQYEKAIQQYERALVSSNTNLNLMLELALLHIQLGNYETALHLHDNILGYCPNHPDMLRNKGFILKKMHRYQDAIATYKQALVVNPQDPRLLRGISHAYLAIGDFERGWPAYEYRWVQPPAYVQQFKSYLQQHNNLEGKTILLKTEYGLGDTMHFIRYAQLVKDLGATVVVESQKPLVNLLSLCPFIDRVIPAGTPTPPTDFTCLLMSLPLVFDTTLETIPQNIPYLQADEHLVSFWADQLNKKLFNVGICWQAEVHQGSDNARVQKDAQEKSIPLELLAYLSQLPNVRLHSLQKINGLEQLKKLPKSISVCEFGPDFDESHGAFMDTAAVMQHLDLVITIDTSVAHLAGGLGVPVWVLLPYHADWRWMLNRDDSPWYSTMKLFRQSEAGNWTDVVSTIKKELKLHVTQWKRDEH